ncbi:hypothetical protein BCR33DRAFT_847376 [Rhizoclosmatium globosum]|uniref:Wbp11/ELF5/Saf1 N-terminal domain-containing protein n=1 Tax=Rhizoclosmatium globosum TaxID=329046 RepID=A0A1Y2CQS0_9FUNG|nr:hypothetical protein BCR33DRAFT_847376 [Rhizoclosmatium globosum]|eukprot:ORY49380.1 hypothetical protein BCR33DRAFT_847376 [Rhizoclosmatium globosum]
MAKKGKELNPADAHRKKLRKQELKKNKDTKQKKEQLQAAHREALRLVEELQLLNRQEKETPLDKANKTKKDKIEKRLEEINEARRSSGLPAVSIFTVAKPKTKVDDEESKWYHPTFNPHGPKKPKGYKAPGNTDDESDDSDDSDSDSDDSDEEETDSQNVPFDFSNLPIPEGEAPMDAQFYHNLELPEIRLDQPKKVAPPVTAPQPTVPIAYPFQPPPFPFPPGMPPPHMMPPPGVFPLDSSPTSTHAPHFNVQRDVSSQYRQQPPAPNKIETPPASSTSLPAKPTVPVQSGPIVISAEPKMRDLKKELTQFVPPSLLKKRGGAAAKGGAMGGVGTGAVRSGTGFGKFVVDAAPDVGGGGGGADSEMEKGAWIPPNSIVGKSGLSGGDEEYEVFMKDIGQ